MIENIHAGVTNTTTKQTVTAVNDQTQTVAKEPLKAETPSTIVSINGTPPDKPVTYEPTFGGIKKPPL